jgi:hypothetical protein
VKEGGIGVVEVVQDNIKKLSVVLADKDPCFCATSIFLGPKFVS